jgi:hypothetical protein
MSKRLQVLLDESELREIVEVARAHRMTVAEWVRQALRTARKNESYSDVSLKLEGVRSAARHTFPVGDVEQMLAEIEKGYIS